MIIREMMFYFSRQIRAIYFEKTSTAIISQMIIYQVLNLFREYSKFKDLRYCYYIVLNLRKQPITLNFAVITYETNIMMLA